MSRIVVDPDGLDRVARQLAQAGADLEDTAHQLAMLGPALPAALSGAYGAASWPIQRSLAVEGAAITRLAAELRMVRRAVELAERGGFDPRLAIDWSRDWRRRPPVPPPASGGGHVPTDEEILRSLRQRFGWQLAARPGGLLQLQLSTAAAVRPRQGTGSGTGAVAAAVIVLGLLLAAAGAAGGGTDTSTSSRPPGPDCDAGGHGRDVDLAKKVLLDPAHIDAVKRESQGHVVHLKADGRPSDHVTEYRQEQDRVRNRIGG